MSSGPLRRATGVLGLLALVPVVVQFVTGAIGPEVAATRALVVAVVVVLVGRAAHGLVRTTLRRFEVAPEAGPSGGDRVEAGAATVDARMPPDVGERAR